MRKGIIIGIVLLSCLGFSAGVSANMLTSKKPVSYVMNDVRVDPGSFTGMPFDGLPVDQFSVSTMTRLLTPFTPYFTFEQVDISDACNAYSPLVTQREVERVAKDHLLHLFPFHNFW